MEDRAKPFRILVAEDNIDDAMLTRRALRNLGPQVEFAIVEDGRLALEAMDTSKFDLAILDIKMPRMSGLEVLERMRPDDHPPAVIFTSSSVDWDRDRAAQLGARSFYTKPMDLPGYCSMVTHIVEEAMRASGRDPARFSK